jgi:hypothetical protein
MLIVKVQPEDVDLMTLSACQAAGEGCLAGAMGMFVRWIAGRYEEIQRQLQSRLLAMRTPQSAAGMHARTPAAVAELRAGWEIFLQFALEAGAIEKGKQQELSERGKRALDELARVQSAYQHTGDPAVQFVAMLRRALTEGRAHVADRQGEAPPLPERWGWRRKDRRRAWIPMGARIGWLVGGELYLDSGASYRAVQQQLGGDSHALSEQTLRRRLAGHGLLASIDTGRGMLLIRRTLEGQPRHVLHLKAGIFAEE